MMLDAGYDHQKIKAYVTDARVIAWSVHMLSFVLTMGIEINLGGITEPMLEALVNEFVGQKVSMIGTGTLDKLTQEKLMDV